MTLNTPWVESPFFEEELSKRTDLTETEKENARFYHENGYLILTNVFSETETGNVRKDLETTLKDSFQHEDPRAMNLWEKSKPIKKMAIKKAIAKKLEMLYGRRPIPFQTLNFKRGSQQNPHSDTIHFSSFPERFMCAAWVALEDMDKDNGTVVYYPGSHKLRAYDYSHLIPDFNVQKGTSQDFYQNMYEPLIQQLMTVHGFPPKILHIKRGDVLIWSANLIHGGLPVKDKSRTRWSQVTHYYFEDCLYYTPQLSNKVSGEWFLRKIQNIETGKTTWGSYNGHSPKRKVVPGFRYLISDYASYNWRDFFFIFTRLYYKFFKS